jgi:alanyl-tRNA synthetase
MTGNEVRSTFLNYFARHGHKIVKSSPLLPANDPTLLFTNAGMNQFKDVFLGAEKRDYKRATSSQKCVRAGGKHNDLDEVGKTARHHTFFEMLGNFSFGDYFKEDAIRFAWDLMVNEWKMDPARLWFSVFAGDDEVSADEEAERLWQKVGASPDRILRFGRKDNFWQMGETGPCGPCSEIHYYLGENPNDPNFNKSEYVNGEGDDTVEIWNLVFMQYNRIEEAPGKYRLESLPAPSVDTGAGLERVTAVLQGVKSNFETDLIRPIIDFTAKLAGKNYVYNDSEESVSMRVIADHARATAFLIADGIFPGNEGRGYVLRKIMRRAIWHGQRLGFKDLFFSKVTNFVVEGLMGAVYPELTTSRDVIERVVRFEEQRFGSTLATGLKKLDELIGINRIADTGEVTVPALELARLYDTFGTPIDLMYAILTQEKYKLQVPIKFPDEAVARHYEIVEMERVTEENFRKGIEGLLKELQQQKAGSQTIEHKQANPVYVALSRRHDTKSEFTGYETTKIDDSKIVALIKDDKGVQSLSAGDSGEAVLSRTPFYSESGGQIGDVGRLLGENTNVVVEDTYSPIPGLIVHKVKVERGDLKVGDIVSAEVDDEKREATKRNHTATHLLHAALREVLGTHVKQAGSLVAPDRLRFDFTHFAPLTQEEIAEIERLVNEQTLKNTAVSKEEKTLDEALSGGAMALFGEKYSDRVRVVSVPGFSTELCGGTHVNATGDIGVFKIISDASIASGTRRIEAVTGKNAYERFALSESLLAEAAARLNTAPKALPVEVERLQIQLRDQQKEIERLKLKLAQGGGSAEDQVVEVNGLKVLVRKVEGLGKDGRRQLADSLTRKVAPGVVVLGEVTNGAASLVVMVSKDATNRVQAGNVIKELTAISGKKGGGKPDLAEGGALPEKLDETLKAAPQVIGKMLGA